MCDRYSITVDRNTIEYHFNARFVSGQHDFEPTYNAAPSQLLPIITTYAPSAIVLASWGFVPEDWKSSRIRPQNNARLETAAEKPMFRSSFAGWHCLVLTDGFYEWHPDPATGRKQPYRFVMKSGEPFAMAGIYARAVTAIAHRSRLQFSRPRPTTSCNQSTTACRSYCRSATRRPGCQRHHQA